MSRAHATPTVADSTPVAKPTVRDEAGGPASEPIDQLRQRFARHDRPLAEVRRLVDASMGERRLTDELRALRDDA